jgi:Glyoxalase/Bleomycin resistance protein/Dioxygenase superfamily
MRYAIYETTGGVMTAQTMTKAVPVLPAHDIIEALEFYTQKLGFTDSWTSGDPVEYGGVNVPVELHFYKSENPDIAHWTSFRVLTHDLDALYERCQAFGVIHPNGALEKKPWGTREFAVLDANGVCIYFYEETL